MHSQTAFGGMLQGIVELTSIVLRSEALDTKIERRCKRVWEEAPCPDCEETAVQTRDDSPRVWCSSCRYVFTYTRNTPPEGRQLAPGEILIAFVLYADPLLSINQIAQLFDSVYDTIHITIRKVEAAFEIGFHLVWTRLWQMLIVITTNTFSNGVEKRYFSGFHYSTDQYAGKDSN